MVAIVTRNGLGLERSSAFVLGSSGQLGSATFGRFGENVAVNAATGNLMINRTDEILIGQGPDSTLGRAYNSLDTTSGIGSAGNWRMNAQRTVTLTSGTVNTAGSTVTRIDADGSNTVYAWNTTVGRYHSANGGLSDGAITFASNVWTWTDGHTRVSETYDNLNGGRILTSKDTNNNQLTYTYTSGKLTRVTVTDTSGTNERTDLTWSGNNMTQIVTTLQGGATLTRTRYTYDGSNRLSTVTTDLTPNDNSVTDGATVVTTYTYDGSSNRVASIAQTGGALLSITYDGSNRVQSISQTLASGVTNASTFSYNTTTRVTTITDQAGQVTTMTYDTSNRLTQIVLPAAQSGATAQTRSFTYNAEGNVLTETDGSGNVTTYEYDTTGTGYDASGNNILVRDARGNTVTRTFSPFNKVLTETRYTTPDPDGSGAGLPSGSFTTRYAYNTATKLRFVVSALGEVTEYIYNGFGQLTSTIVYRGSSYNITGLSDATAISESSLNTWVSGITDKSTVQRADTTYDFRGNISTVKTFTKASTSGVGSITDPYTTLTYTYDQYGNLLTRATSGITNTEVFTYDGLGRLKTSTDLNGASTSVVFTDASNQAVATLANGLVQTSIYNLAGALISYAQSGSGITTGTTNYAYDAMGQLRMVTDATGNKTYYLYDYVGRKVADISASGSLTEYRYDQSDRLVSTTSYATKLTAPQIASLVSGGAPASILLSSVRPSANALDVWNWRIYDTANRLIEAIDGNGGAVIFAYDGASNLVSTSAYANKIAAATVTGFKTTAPTALQTPTASASSDNVSRNFYDKNNRLIGVLNGDGYLTRIVYNEAGEKVQTTAFAVITQAANRASGTFATLLTDVGTNAADINVRYVYDGQGNLKYTLDNNLRPTEYFYDNAGQLLHTLSYGAPIVSAPTTYTVDNVAAKVVATSGLATHADNRTSWAVYDAAGRAAYTIDANGGVTRLVYDSVGQVVKKISYSVLRSTTSDPSLATMDSWATTNASSTNDRMSRIVYDQAGRVVYTVDPEGYVNENRYDTAGRVTLNIRYAAVYTVADGATPASMVTLIGGSIPSTAVQTSFSYDVDGRVVDSYDGAGVRTKFVYDALGRVTDKTVAFGHATDAATTRYVYDAAGRLSSQTDAYGATEATTTSRTYDGLGNILTVTDGRGFITTYTYDNIGLVKTVTAPIDGSNSAVTTNYFDAFGNVIRTNDPRGNDSFFFYDNLNRLTHQIDGEKYVTKYTYTIGNAIATITHYATKVAAAITAGTLPTITTAAADAVTTFLRDKLDRVTRVTDAESKYEEYTLDAFGNQTVVRNKLNGYTNNIFDRRGLLTAETKTSMASVLANGTTQASSVTNKFEYDARGNRTKMIEAFGLVEQRTTTYTYDKMDRLLTTTGDAVVTVNTSTLQNNAAAAPITTNVYDARGNLIQSTDPAGAKTLFYYDDLNRKIAVVNAVGTLSTWVYDANGNATSQRVFGDAVALPGSPGGTAPSPVNASNYRETVYAYDRANRLTTTTVSNVQYGYYNGSVFTQGTTSLVVTNTYDKNGNIISQQDARGNNVFYYYDKRGGKIAQVDQGKYLTSYTLDADGNVTKEERFATALSSAPTTSSDPATLRTSVVGNANDRITNFTYDRNGRRLTEQRTGVTAYTVNSSGTRSVASTNATITYTYDGLGNVLTKTEATGDQATYVYDLYGRQTSISTQGFTDWTTANVTPTTLLSYDGLNNLTRAVANTTQFTTNIYGAGGRLATSTDASGFVVTYGYDAAGRTVKQSYSRVKSDNSSVTEAKTTKYDLLGRATYQGVAAWNGSSWVFGDYKNAQYNTFGEITASGTNGLWQETTSYDNAGHAWKTTAGDGVTKIRYFDQNGNQTLEVTSDGSALPAGGYTWPSLTIAQINALQTAGSVPFGSTSVAGMVLTYKVYDARGLNTSTVEPLRKIDTSGANNTITKSRAYNAFGEVTSDTNARGYTTIYSYNTIGKLIQTENPPVKFTNTSGVASSTAVATFQKNYYDLSGRLVSVEDANGNTTNRFLLAGTGYGGTEVSVAKEFAPDGGLTTNEYDVFGNLKRETVKIDASNNRVTLMDYDAMGRLTTLQHATRLAGSAGNLSGSNQTLIDYYFYDGLGQRITHWNNQYGSSFKDRTDYDMQGRVVQSIDLEGHVTSTSYTWSSAIGTSVYVGGGSLGTFGGWTQATTNSTGRTSFSTVDFFNRAISKTDFGGNVSNYKYDLAGRLADQTVTANEHIEYRYYNTGQLKSIDDIAVTYNYNGVNGYDPGSTSLNYDYSYAFYYHVNGTPYIAGYDSGGNPINSFYDSLYATYYELRKYTTGTSHYYFTETYATTTTDQNTTFEYDLDGNRTYEGAYIDVTTATRTKVTRDTTVGTTYHTYTTYAGSGVAHNAHYYQYQEADPATYHWEYQAYQTPYYYWEYDSCYNGSTWYWDGVTYNTAYQYVEVQNPQTYHTAYATWYSDDAYYFSVPTYADNYAGQTTTRYIDSDNTVTPATARTWLEHEDITYDAMNRITKIDDDGYNLASPMTIDMEYDKNGNTMRRKATYRAMDANGSLAGTNSIQDNYYKYDSMNRFTTTKGTLSGGAIVRGADGIDISYDLAGNRKTATTTRADNTIREETYTYSADGLLAKVDLRMNDGTWGAPRALAEYGLDTMGRTTSYKEFGEVGGVYQNTYTRTANYDKISQVTSDDTTMVRSDGIYYSHTDYSYVTQAGSVSGVSVSNGSYLGGVLVKSTTSNSHRVSVGSALITDATTSYTNTYTLRDNAQIASSTYVSDSTQTVHHAGYWETWTNSYSSTWHDPWDEVVGSSTAWVSNYTYNGQGHLKKVDINDGQPRTVTYISNMMGQVMKRDVAYNSGPGPAPHELHYYLAGMAIGDITNNGTSNADYVTSIAARVASSQGYGPFRNGASEATPYADFDQSYDPINGSDSTSAPTNYVIKSGDTLQSLARSLWGDANLWYLIAQANGLNANSTLAVGMSIVIPNNQVHNFHNSSSTFKVYDPNLAVGDVSPTAPEIPKPPPPPPPPPAPARKGGGCGIIGKILMVVVAIAVVAVTAGAAIAALAPASAGITGIGSALGAMAAGTTGLSIGTLVAVGAAAGAAGSIVSQGVGVATGIQDKFNWGGVAMGAIAGGVGAGLASAGGAFSSLGSFGGTVARGVASSVVTQGIGVATGLQSHFDWAGVAAAGVGAGVGSVVGQSVQGKFRFGDDLLNTGAEMLGAGMATGIANAATRSIISGTDFGDNIMAALPDTIGQTIGNMMVSRLLQPSDAEMRSANAWQALEEYSDEQIGHLKPINFEDELFDLPNLQDDELRLNAPSPDGRGFVGELYDDIYSIGQEYNVLPATKIGHGLDIPDSLKGAPSKIYIPTELQEGFDNLWGNSYPTPQGLEDGETVAANKFTGALSAQNVHGKERIAGGSFIPDLNLRDDNTYRAAGLFHSHPYPNHRYSGSLSGADAAVLINNRINFVIAQSEGKQYMYLKTGDTVNGVNYNRLTGYQQGRVGMLQRQGMDFSAATSKAALETAQRYGLAYYEGSNGTLTRVYP
jgi:YD repeat-containing protein